MKMPRRIPPAATQVSPTALCKGLIGLLVGKQYLSRLEAEIREFFGVRHVFLMSSGKAALTLALLGLKAISSRSRVVVPAYTCFSVPSAVIKAGLEIVPCDVSVTTLDYDFTCLERLVDDSILCVVATHLFGSPSDVDRINKLCKKNGVFVVEDAAQAMGAEHKGVMLGTVGDVGFFSLGRGKNITCGSGGIIVTSSDEIGNAIACCCDQVNYPRLFESLKELIQVFLMSILIRPNLYWITMAMPWLKLGQTIFYTEFPVKRLSGMKAGLLHDWRKRLLTTNRIRQETVRYYRKALNLTMPILSAAPYTRLPVLVDNSHERDRIYAYSLAHGLGVSVMYPSPINEIRKIRDSFDGRQFPAASEVAKRLVTLPTHSFLSDIDKQKICRLLKGFVMCEVGQARRVRLGF